MKRQDEFADTDHQRILKHRGRKNFVCPWAQDTLATPLHPPAILKNVFDVYNFL